MHNRKIALLALVGLALLPLVGDLRADAEPQEIRALREALRESAALTEQYAFLLSACLNGKTLFVGNDMVFCDRHTVRIAK
jgi:hypothetical protein